MKNKTKDDNKSNDSEVVVIDLISDESETDVNDEETDVTDETEIEEQEMADEEDKEEEEEYLDLQTEEVNKPKKAPKLSAKFCGSIIGSQTRTGDKRPLYSVQFNTYLPNGHNYFAAVGSDQVMVFECPDNGKGPLIRLIDCFSDSTSTKCPTNGSDLDKKKNKSEDYYTCCWSFDDKTGNPLVISGGLRGIIRIIDCALKTSRHMSGHGGAINDLKVSPFDHNLLLSSSEDYSLRLWNLKTRICLAKFCGESGHRDQVISADFYLLSDKYFVSTGMDHSIKIWSLDNQEIRDAIKESYVYEESAETCFPIQSQHFPVFTTRKLHANYIDCVQFFGKFVLSKSCDNEIMCSIPDFLDNENGFSPNRITQEVKQIGAFELKDTNYWFIKFSMDFEQSLLSVGNNSGLTFVWDMNVDDPFEYEPLVLERKKCKSIIRQTSLSTDGKILICVCDDSSIWRWNITRD